MLPVRKHLGWVLILFDMSVKFPKIACRFRVVSQNDSRVRKLACVEVGK